MGALSGLRVVEMNALGPVPLAGQMLADHGADVVLIDRASGPENLKDVNRRGKRSMAVNLKSEEGLAAARALIDRADVLIEGFRPGVMEKLGLGPEPLIARNPGLIFGRMTGWGQTGPIAQTAGHDLNYLAITGALGAMGKKGEPPVPPLNLVADYGGGAMFLLFGVLAALFERQTSGKGQIVDAAMCEGVPAMMGLMHGMMGQGQWSSQQGSNLLDGAAPFYRCYECADGKFLSVGALEPQFFAELVSKSGLPEAHRADQGDPRNWAARSDEYEAHFKTKTRDEWADIFAQSDACVMPVLEWGELEAHPQNAARGTFLRKAETLQAAPAPRFSRSPAGEPDLPGAAGAQSDEVLRELGYSDEDVAALREGGAVT